MPKGLKMKKLIERPDGTLVHDTSYVGEDAWEDDREAPEERVKQIIEDDERLNKEEKKELTKGLGISGYLCIFWFFYSFTFHLNLFFLFSKALPLSTALLFPCDHTLHVSKIAY